jgi:hypothetical protein
MTPAVVGAVAAGRGGLAGRGGGEQETGESHVWNLLLW